MFICPRHYYIKRKKTMKNTKKVLRLWLIMFAGIVTFVLIGLGLFWLSAKYPRAVPLVFVVAGIALYVAYLVEEK